MKLRVFISTFFLLLIFSGWAGNDPKMAQNYPNPAKEKTVIELDYTGNNATLTVYNVLGESIREIKIEKPGKFELNVSNLPDGVYLYTLDVDGYKVTKRMTVKK